jgi:co-chaperonin GroES (HSP10)
MVPRKEEVMTSIALVNPLPSKKEAKAPEKKASQLPEPKGYKLLIALPDVEEKTEGGILKASETIRNETVATVVGFVLELGPDAYKDENKFPTGPYCKKGDWVVFRAYSGTRVKIHGKEFRIINDDTVEAVVDDPRGVERV